jgi:cyclopropane fatty-acyl-phospholipid synthase-like methyltransferase
MLKEYFNIRDNCRKGLLKYLYKAISIIPQMEKPLILDIGCGTGVPTLALAEKSGGDITAVDIDCKSINRLKEKVQDMNLTKRITIHNCSFFDIEEKNQFDLIIAEGILNVVGFRRGFQKIKKLLKRNGYIIIHDEASEQNKKINFLESSGFKIIDTFKLNAQVWWNDYYKCLVREISSLENNELSELFKPDLKEIASYNRDSSQFNSMYYIIAKEQ